MQEALVGSTGYQVPVLLPTTGQAYGPAGFSVVVPVDTLSARATVAESPYRLTNANETSRYGNFDEIILKQLLRINIRDVEKTLG